MRITNSILKAFALLLILSLHTNKSKAGILPASEFIQSVPGTLVQIGTPAAFKNVALNPLTGNFIDYDIKDYVSLTVPLDQYNYTEPFTLTAAIKVTPRNSTNVIQYPDTETVVLTINYNPYTGVTTFNDAERKLFGWHHPQFDMELKELQLSVNGAPSAYVNDLPAFVRIDGNITANRIMDFSFLNPAFTFNAAPQGKDINCDPSGTVDEIEVTWTPQDEAEEYDLEWTYVNNYGQLIGTPYNASTAIYNFDNCSRITTSFSSYRISNIYDQGFIVFRIRAVGRDINNPSVVVYGEWDLPANSGTVASATTNRYYEILVDHEHELNWQVSTTFAEDGKKKEVISYFDGSFKNRETVTKTNTENNAVVGQTIYDSYGRAAISVLPVPVVMDNDCPDPIVDQTNPIMFYPKFNRNLNGNQYSATDFDLNGNVCPPLTPPAAPMGTTSGASQYYSDQNLRLSPFRDLIPDAEKYPFSQVEFTPDNTGRVRRQGSVGTEFQLNGKSSLYLYGQPNQLQLDRFFGPEAGDATHYKKNIVIDPNGQASVAYVDMKGKTVATSLTGNKPDNMLWMFDNDPPFSLLKVDLLNKDANGHSSLNIPNANNDALVFNTTVLVADQEEYTFNYDVTVASFQDTCMYDSICFDCIYDLEIRVIDECGVDLAAAANIFGQYAPATAIVGTGVTYDNINHVYNLNLNTSCLDSVPGDTIYKLVPPLVLDLAPGTYSVYKILHINSAARNYYLQQYLTQAVNKCFVPIADFHTINSVDVDLDDCHVTCASCVEALGDRDLFISSGQGSAEQFDAMVIECNAPCNPPDECQVIYYQMLADVSIGGQYAEYIDQSNGSINPGIFPVSVLNESDYLPMANSNWRYPVNYDPLTLAQVSTHYREDDGTESHVTVF
ncbi:MAG: hypothetical protein ABI772_12345, partial [Bacteroidota bacterium]